MVHCDFENVVSKATLGRKGGGHKKEQPDPVYALDNVDNSRQPLSTRHFQIDMFPHQPAEL